MSAPALATTTESDELLGFARTEIERDGVIFNRTAWAEVVAQCYGFSDCSASVGGGSLPLFHTRSPLLGDKIVSAVYNSYASPLYRDASACFALVERAIELAHRREVAFLELKCLFPLPDEVVAACGLIRRDRYTATFVPLAGAAACQARYSANFRRHLRRTARGMRTAGARIERSASLRDLERFYDVLVRRYRDKHRMIPQPWQLFELILQRFLAGGDGDLWLVRMPNGDIATAILCLRAGNVVTACFGASAERYRALSVDAVLKDTMMQRYAGEGARIFDLGVTSLAQESVLFSKSRFGGVTARIPVYYFLVRAERVSEIDYATAYAWARRAFRHVPLALVRRLSPVIVPYLN